MAQQMSPPPAMLAHQPQQPRVSFSPMPAQSPPAPPGSMGPPQRPADRAGGGTRGKATDINDLSDAVTAAGIDVANEESYLNEIYHNRQGTASFSTSFNSQTSSTISPDTSFGAWTQGGSGAFQGSGPTSQPAKSPEDVEKEFLEKKRRAAEILGEQRSHHLNDPFLLGNCVQRRIRRKAYDHGVKINLDGLFEKISEEQPSRGVQATMHSNGSDVNGIVAVKAHSLLNDNTPLVDILTLVSLATQERLRGLLEEAHGIARNRQLTSHGIVPPEFASLAVGTGKPRDTSVSPQLLSGTAWDQPPSAASPTANPLKRPHQNSASLPTPPNDSPSTPQKTIVFPNSLIDSLRLIAKNDRKYEEERLAKRAKRRKLAKPADGTSSPTVAEATAVADAVAINTKLTKKERDKLAKSNQTEEVLHREANKTASLAMGGMGKKYSWMSGGAKGGSGANTPKVNTAVPRPGSAKPAEKGVQGRNRAYGDFREDRDRGIQMRDLLAVLEADGRERRAVVRGYTTRMKGSNTA
ncbi:hypothetical protein EJ05DRAFT_46126 [Pseudovirgaria hyperparasitica]|uniref:Transcription initiation factor TFIID subunit 4 n=1 Tax=Pseudovirgaria hyperparasitica TaxID=470096 RepID=A0A6A6W2Q9_9PEZI|nr:uncharacterized protein EJ05DRAFT_46126 [Pseudovirgaria hyperparasitica]KAF2756873.1 hypothetical protein EJ05DRAFT_46126 [Pseudovirgaria hyperparasitica]